jgi:hypothetical protein
MPSGNFVIQSDGTLIEMREEPYDSEVVLQALLAKYPNLLAGDQMKADEPRRWLLVTREMRVPGDEGADRGSLDHLFLDQDAVPTLVEVKRSENTQLRREVVGQMLDYAANGVVFWSIEEIKARFERSCSQRQVNPDELLAGFLGPDAGPEEFWQKVKTNLQAGRIRLIFVADDIPPGLRRIVEFLNGQMDPAEVLAVEVKQHVGQGMKALVPSLVGQTATAQRVKAAGASPARQWDESSFFKDLETRQPTAVCPAKLILEWAKPKAQIKWGEGMRSGSFTPYFRHKGVLYPLFAVYSYGSFEVFFMYYMERPPFDEEALRLELLTRLQSVPGVSLPPDCIARRPPIQLAALADDGRTEALLGVFDWVLERISHA